MSDKLSIPDISVIVVIYNMQREAKRTLFSLSTAYQKDVTISQYEIIVVDNGSSESLPSHYFNDLRCNFRYYYLPDSLKSPAKAINFGFMKSRGRYVGIMIDGARILTPGVLKYALMGFQAFNNVIISTLAWHIGPDVQNRSILHGYTREIEDELLDSIDWAANGYRLFEISHLAMSSEDGWFLPIAESNCLFMSRDNFEKLGGYNEKFVSLGGGLVNLDVYQRACELDKTDLLIILGEGSFHQIHGGVATNVPEHENLIQRQIWANEYFQIRSKNYSRPNKKALYIGHLPVEAKKVINYSFKRYFESPP